MIGNTLRTRLLAVGLVVAVLVMLQPQLRLALDAVHTFETQIGLALVPTAVILMVVLLVYFQARRHDQRIQQLVGDARSRERQGRDSVLDGLTRFGLALARANDMGIVRDVVLQALPQFTAGRPFWAVVRGKGKWESNRRWSGGVARQGAGRGRAAGRPGPEAIRREHRQAGRDGMGRACLLSARRRGKRQPASWPWRRPVRVRPVKAPIGVERWGRRRPSWASPPGTSSSPARSRRTGSTTV